jgi:hypothetical protein
MVEATQDTFRRWKLLVIKSYKLVHDIKSNETYIQNTQNTNDPESVRLAALNNSLESELSAI